MFAFIFRSSDKAISASKIVHVLNTFLETPTKMGFKVDLSVSKVPVALYYLLEKLVKPTTYCLVHCKKSSSVAVNLKFEATEQLSKTIYIE